jgi:hypothetical protein
LQSDVAAIPSPGGGEPAAVLDRMQQRVRAVEDKWRQREQVISTVVKSTPGGAGV